MDSQDAQRLAQNLNQAGHPVSPQDVIPTTSETPIEKSPELDQVGADITGEDLSYIVKNTLGGLTTGASTTRTTKSAKFLNLLKGMFKKKHPDETVVFK